MSKERVYNPPQSILENSNISDSEFEELYKKSLENPDQFWSEQADIYLDWDQRWSQVQETNIEKGEIAWFKGGKLNASVNCIDRHLPDKSEKIAFIWEGDNPDESLKISYKELHKKVCNLSNALKNNGVKKGDRITIYMPMIPEAAYAMLACSRIGAIHSVVFGGFSPEALAGRILDCNSHYVITADEGIRGNKSIPLKANTDAAINIAKGVRHCVVVKRTGGNINWVEGRDVWYEELINSSSLIVL